MLSEFHPQSLGSFSLLAACWSPVLGMLESAPDSLLMGSPQVAETHFTCMHRKREVPGHWHPSRAPWWLWVVKALIPSTLKQDNSNEWHAVSSSRTPLYDFVDTHLLSASFLSLSHFPTPCGLFPEMLPEASLSPDSSSGSDLGNPVLIATCVPAIFFTPMSQC